MTAATIVSMAQLTVGKHVQAKDVAGDWFSAVIVRVRKSQVATSHGLAFHNAAKITI